MSSKVVRRDIERDAGYRCDECDGGGGGVWTEAGNRWNVVRFYVPTVRRDALLVRSSVSETAFPVSDPAETDYVSNVP